MIGRQILNYTITKHLGEGGMGTVFIGEHTQLNRKVAIKILNPQLSKIPDIRLRFKNEASALSLFDHPNIVRLIDYCENENDIFLIMEYVDGRPLDKHIQTVTGPIPEEIAVKMFTMILDGVGYAHSQHVVHRDIKPSNFMVTTDGRIKILDFGIAKIVGDEAHKLTKTGTQIGTIAYMSPEQVKGVNLDHRSDIYSLGVTLFQMVTGHCPYDATTTDYLIYKRIVEEPLPPAKQYYAFVSDAMQNIINKATAKNPEDRFQTCESFKNALLNIQSPNNQKTVIVSEPLREPVREPVREIVKEPVEGIKTIRLSDSSPQIPKQQPVTPAKSNKKIFLIAGIALFAVIALVIGFFIMYHNKIDKFNKILSQAELYMYNAQYDSAKIFYHKAIEYYDGDKITNDKAKAIDFFVIALDSFYAAKYESAYKNFEQASLFELPEAFYYLGEMTFNGVGTKEDVKKATEFTKKSIDYGFEMANWRMGNVYLEGKGVEKDTILAEQYFSKASNAILRMADKGDPEAQGNLGGLYNLGKGGFIKDEAKSLEWHKKAAEQNYAFEQVSTGLCYWFTANPALDEALKWITKAADQGDSRGEYFLGLMYYQGKGVAEDKLIALKWFKKSAEHNYAPASYIIGYMYYKAIGVVKDINESIKWFEKAAQLNDRDALNELGDIYSNGEVTPDYNKALDYYYKAAEKNNLLALYNIGNMYETGKGVTYDIEKAISYYKQAANKGHVYSMNHLGMIYFNGSGVEPNYTEAKIWFKKGADAGDASCRENYDYLVSNGY